MGDTMLSFRSLGVANEGLPDQYADGKAAKVWEIYIGEKNDRTKHYRKFLIDLLKEHDCQKILDVACGTGIDSILLVEEGFDVMSIDASDKMLKYAIKERWNRRNEPGFDKWVIEEANWLTLPEDIHKPNDGFDAVICLGNSFAHLFDTKGDMSDIKLAIKNFHEMLKPNGYLLIDHRNYDYTLKQGRTPAHSIYYNSKHIKDIQTSILYSGEDPKMVMLDYTMDISDIIGNFDRTDSVYTKKGRLFGKAVDHFRLTYYPHRLNDFTQLLKGVFGEKSQHEVYGDFKPLDEVKDPAFYIHFIQKQAA